MPVDRVCGEKTAGIVDQDVDAVLLQLVPLLLPRHVRHAEVTAQLIGGGRSLLGIDIERPHGRTFGHEPGDYGAAYPPCASRDDRATAGKTVMHAD